MTGPLPNLDYVTRVPTVVEPGRRLVHNFPPGRPRRRSGDDGFRYWTEDDVPNPRRSLCGCEWDAPTHWTTVRR